MEVSRPILYEEKHVKREVRKILDLLGVCWFMPAASVYSKNGVADFIICVHGRYVAVETKRPDKGVVGLTALQRDFRSSVLENRGVHMIVYDWETIDRMLRKLESIILYTKEGMR